ETHLDRERRLRRPGIDALERLDVVVVAPADDGDMVQADEYAVGRVERHPAAVPELDPGVALAFGGLADVGLTLGSEVPRDVAGRHTEAAQRADGDVREVLADASALGPGLSRTGVPAGAPAVGYTPLA